MDAARLRLFAGAPTCRANSGVAQTATAAARLGRSSRPLCATRSTRFRPPTRGRLALEEGAPGPAQKLNLGLRPSPLGHQPAGACLAM